MNNANDGGKAPGLVWTIVIYMRITFIECGHHPFEETIGRQVKYNIRIQAILSRVFLILMS